MFGNNNGNNFRGPYYDAMTKFAPILVAVIFTFAIAVAVLDFIQDRRADSPPARPVGFPAGKNEIVRIIVKKS